MDIAIILSVDQVHLNYPWAQPDFASSKKVGLPTTIHRSTMAVRRKHSLEFRGEIQIMRKPIDQLGDLQRAVLESVWDLDGGSVQDVIDHLRPKRKPAYTTVLTTLQNLTKAGWVKPKKNGRAYVYHATRTRAQAGGKSIVAFVRRAFDGNTRVMLQTLLDEQDLSEEELNELRKMIDRKRREKKQ